MGKTGEQAEEALSWDEDEVVRVIVELSQQPALESMSVESVQTAASAENCGAQKPGIYNIPGRADAGVGAGASYGIYHEHRLL